MSVCMCVYVYARERGSDIKIVGVKISIQMN